MNIVYCVNLSKWPEGAEQWEGHTLNLFITACTVALSVPWVSMKHDSHFGGLGVATPNNLNLERLLPEAEGGSQRQSVCPAGTRL